MWKRIFLFAVAMSTAATAEPFRQTLTSAEHGVHVETWETSSQKLKFKSAAPWSVKKFTLHGGKQEGVDVIVVNNGKVSFTVIPTRGMGVLEAKLGDVRLGWNSPVKEVVHPHFINLQSRGGLGWLEGFNEWMVRCGLEFAGHPGKDKFITNTGDEAEMDLTLHGKIGNLPASEVEVVIDRELPHRIRVRGRVDERMFYGPKLELWAEISTEPGANTFRIEDKITNHGAYEQEFQLIYHANYGPPLLEKGSRFIAPLQRVTPFNTHAAKAVNAFREYAAPAKGFVEQVYCLDPLADEKGRTTIMLRNAASDRAVTMSYPLEQLPHLTLWKNTTALEEGYVTGLEPGTGFPYNRRIERKFGRVPKLAPGQSRQFAVDYAIHVGKGQVAATSTAIESIQAGRKAEVDAEPPKVE